MMQENSDGTIKMQMDEKKNTSVSMDSMHLYYWVGNEISKIQPIYEFGIQILDTIAMKQVNG